MNTDSFSTSPSQQKPFSLDLAADNRVRVPNKFPSMEAEYRIAFIGEAPGQEEEAHGEPFIGASGYLLGQMLVNANIIRGACFVGNVCQVRPPGNEIKRFAWDGPEIQAGIAQLACDLAEYKPHLCVLLGGTPLRLALGQEDKISEWRGSLMLGKDPASPLFRLKCLPTYHPAACLRAYENVPLSVFDLKRARKEGCSPELNIPTNEYELDLSADEICYRLDNWDPALEMSIDIEGGLAGWICTSNAWSPTDAFIIAPSKFTVEEEMRVMRSLSRVFANHGIRKCLQNSLYENFVLPFEFKMFIRNVFNDTMLKGWELFSELPKGLDTQASIYTRQPQWKHLIAYSKKEQARRAKLGVDPATEIRNKHKACCIDSAVTLEISRVQDTILHDSALAHYRFNVDLLEPMSYMQLRGIRYDKDLASQLLAENAVRMVEQQKLLDMRVGKPLNINSPKQCAQFLYETKGFTPIYKKEHGRNTDKVTTDVEALLTLHKKYGDPAISDILTLRKYDSLRETLMVSTDVDSRVRCGYNLVGTETGRLTCYTSPTGSGANLQTITESLRRLYLADEGHYFFQCDLAGADGWTVAAHCARLGDRTMLEDYLAGIKPAKVIALMYRIYNDARGGPEKIISAQKSHELKLRIMKLFSDMPRELLLEKCEVIKKADWDYFSSKGVQHGSNYEMGPQTTSSHILKQSYKKLGIPIHFPTNDCKMLQELYTQGRYKGLNLWKRWVENEMLTKGQILSASGHTRKLFGRKKTAGKTDQDTFRQALSDEPQQNTTYATNLAMWKLWHDPENHDSRGNLIIEPLHQVHDALCGQFPITHLDWALPKLRSYFDNILVSHGFSFHIPFEGRYGRSWGEQTHSI